jgi:hypothetical protein
MGLLTEPDSGKPEFIAQLFDISTNHVAKFDMFERVPNALIRIEIRGIARQSFQKDAFTATIRQKLFDGLAAVNGSAIPNDQQLARNVPQQVMQKIDYLLTTNGSLLHLHQQLARRCDATDDRQMLIATGHTQNRRFSFGGIGSNGGG